MLVIQKKISIYKALNGAEVADFKLQDFLFEMAMVNMKLNKIEDSERNIVEAEKLLKKFPAGDAETKKREGDCKKMRDELAKHKKTGGAAGAAPAGEAEKKKPEA